MFTVHWPPPAASELPQVFVSEKSLEIEMFEIESGALPTFVSVTVCAALATFCPWLPKSIFCGFKASPGALLGLTSATKALPEVPAPA